jgi:hypothetical protein
MMKAGIIVSRRTQIGMLQPTKPGMITCPAIVPTVEIAPHAAVAPR